MPLSVAIRGQTSYNPGVSTTPKAPRPGAPLPPQQITRPPQKIVPPRRRKSWKEWLGAAIMLAGFCYGGSMVIGAARRVPGFGYFFLALAVLAFVFDVLMLLRGRSMVLVVGAVFAAAAVLTFVPDLALGVVLAILTIAAYVGIMLLLAFRKRA